MGKEFQDIRPSPLAGRWYEGSASALAESVDAFLGGASGAGEGGERPVALVVPHAGHRFSGPVAAHAFARLKGGEIERVVIVGPSHHAHTADLLTTGHDAWETPLGVVPIDRDAVEELSGALERNAGIGLAELRNDPEHSLEIELPFLQRVLADFRLVPIAMVDQSPRTARALGSALAEVFPDDQSTLLVASSDLSHFYDRKRANELDRAMLERVADFDPDGVLAAEEEGIGFACGRGAIAAVFWAAKARGAGRVRILNYATSGDRTGDDSSVVGYGAAEVLKR